MHLDLLLMSASRRSGFRFCLVLGGKRTLFNRPGRSDRRSGGREARDVNLFVMLRLPAGLGKEKHISSASFLCRYYLSSFLNGLSPVRKIS